MIKKIFLILSLWCTSMVVFADSVIYTEDKTAIMITQAEPQFTIKLKSNPTTGYSWFLRDYDAALIQPISHRFEANANKKIIGAPGYEYWIFRVKPAGFSVPQQTVIRFSYNRPWETDQKTQSLFFNVSIMGSNTHQLNRN